MKLSLSLNTSLQQTLTPQQIQYLKLLQLPVLQLEQHLRSEIEQNPMLEDMSDDESTPVLASVNTPTKEQSVVVGAEEDLDFVGEAYSESAKSYALSSYEEELHYNETPQNLSSIDDMEFRPSDADAFDYYKLAWQDDADAQRKSNEYGFEDDGEGFQVKDSPSYLEELNEQLRLLPLSDEEVLIGEHIIGNVETDGYLRRDLAEILEETNIVIAERNAQLKKLLRQSTKKLVVDRYTPRIDADEDDWESKPIFGKKNGSANRSLSSSTNGHSHDKVSGRSRGYNPSSNNILSYSAIESVDSKIFATVSMAQAEKVLRLVQKLDPPGFGSRNMQECLLAQLRSTTKLNAAQKLAVEVLDQEFTAFTMKHYSTISRRLEVTEDYLKEALDVIRKLNPKPGVGNFAPEINSVIPDFVVEADPDHDGDFLVGVNDSRLPAVRVSKAYEKLKKEVRYKKFNKDTREWLRKKQEDAKFMIQAIRQRKNTMLKVMTSIVELQKGFFEMGPAGLRPLIYKDVSETTGMDISTVCRIVNSKYVQTEYGTIALKFFFSESLESDDGEEISTTVIKQRIRELIEKEPKRKPLSDDKLAKELKNLGLNVARRTVAKYREQMRIPVARLRTEL